MTAAYVITFESIMILILGTLIASVMGRKPMLPIVEGLETLAFMILAILPAPRVHPRHTAAHAGGAR